MRILHAPTNIAHQAWSTAQGLRALGHEALVWHYGPNAREFPADRVIEVGKQPELAIRTFLEALDANFDVFHFHFGRSLIPNVGGLPWFWDIPVLRALGKKLIFSFHGSDVRMRNRHLEEDRWSYYRFADVPCDEERIAKQLAVIRTYANRLVVSSVLLRTFVPDAVYVPKAIDLSGFPMVGPRRSRRPLVVHIPSRRATKGTDFVLAGIRRLEEEGADFEFTIAEALPRADFIHLYKEADVIVDNLLLGDCEVSSLEAMALGKPVITRVRDEVLSAHPGLPAANADPDTFVAVMRPLLSDPKRRTSLGEQGRAYVEAHFAAPHVASRLVPLYEAPTRPVLRVFPEWAGIAYERKLEAYEQRIQGLEVKEVELTRVRRTLELKEVELGKLHRKLEVTNVQLTRLRHRFAPIIRIARWARALRRKLPGWLRTQTARETKRESG